MYGVYTVKGIVAILVVLLEISGNATAAWVSPYSSSSFQPIWQRAPIMGQSLRYQPAQGILRQVYTSVQGNQYPTINQVGQAALSPQTLQYQGYKMEPAPSPVVATPSSLSCPSCPAPTAAPVCSAPSCPASVPATPCPAPTPAPICSPASCPAPAPPPSCPAPTPAPACPVLSCPAPVPPPTCPAPTPAPVCPAPVPPPACPAPVPPPACPAPDPAPPCPAPTPAPSPTPVTSDVEKGIMDFQNWQCMSSYDTNKKQTASCTVIGPASSATDATARCPNYVLPVFCDTTVNEVAKAMAARMPAPPAPTVPAGYTLVDNQGYFKVNTNLLTFNQAKDACAADGAILAVPQTPEDYPPLWQMVKTAWPGYASGFFIGFTQNRIPKDFEYSLTNQRVCTTGLFRHQNIYETLAGENCSTIGFGLWADLQDVPCSWVIPSLCQIPLPSRYMPAPCA